MPSKATAKQTWAVIEENCQAIAVDSELVPSGTPFTLTGDQQRGIKELNERIGAGERRILLKAPTGSGKTEIFFRTLVTQVLERGGYGVVLVPTRDLARQQANYLEERLVDSDLEVAQMHAGIPPRTRRQGFDLIRQGKVSIVVGSALLLQNAGYRWILNDASIVVVDDVNAFDEEEDLRYMHGVKAPAVFVTATPEAVGRFLRREGCMDNPVALSQMPFDSPPTVLHEEKGEWGENPFRQLERAHPLIEKHIAAGSRIYIISRTRSRVGMMGNYMQERYKVPVSILHGEMADTVEHRKRFRGKGPQSAGANESRVSMMEQFRYNSPAILVATNLVGSGLDVPMADLVVVTDADHFGVAEIEQLMGRVGRREKASDAFLVRGTSATPPQGLMVKGNTRIRNGKVVQTFKLQPRNRRGYNPRRIV
jgi:ATP-dependent DNA helicase RecG